VKWRYVSTAGLAVPYAGGVQVTDGVGDDRGLVAMDRDDDVEGVEVGF
jgi:hypothetical protein